MQCALKIIFRDRTASDELEQDIRDRAAKLDELCPDMTSCHVAIAMPQPEQVFNAHISARLPDSEIAVNHHDNEDVHAALRAAFDSLCRQVEEHMRWRRAQAMQCNSQCQPSV